jgi:septal ring factor EnvC (AmiA/AmiB activator)
MVSAEEQAIGTLQQQNTQIITALNSLSTTVKQLVTSNNNIWKSIKTINAQIAAATQATAQTQTVTTPPPTTPQAT